MTSFYKNICRFNPCGLEFATVYDLIQHIEENHIGNDSDFQKRFESSHQQSGHQPAPLVSLSYICRYFQTMPDRKPKPVIPEPILPTSITLPKKRPSISAAAFNASARSSASSPAVVAQQQQNISFQPNISRNSTNSSGVATPLGSELDEENGSVDNESLSSDSTVVEETANVDSATFSSVNSRFMPAKSLEDRRYPCPVPGCKKKYKNINGVRYHSKMAHQGNDQQAQIIKPYKCAMCSKAYKTNNGLHNHQVQTGHKSSTIASNAAPILTKLAPHAALIPNSGTTAKAIRVSPAQSPAPFAANISSASLKFPTSSQLNVSPTGVSIQVQQGVSSAATTTVHVPQQGAAAAAVGVHRSSFNNSAAARTYNAANMAGLKRSASVAQMAHPGVGGRPAKLHQRVRQDLGYVLQHQQQQQQQNEDAVAATTIMGPPLNAVPQYFKKL